MRQLWGYRMDKIDEAMGWWEAVYNAPCGVQFTVYTWKGTWVGLGAHIHGLPFEGGVYD